MDGSRRFGFEVEPREKLAGVRILNPNATLAASNHK
jgi:hypothetical protein